MTVSTRDRKGRKRSTGQRNAKICKRSAEVDKLNGFFEVRLKATTSLQLYGFLSFLSVILLLPNSQVIMSSRDFRERVGRAPASGRTKDYFIPKDGIDREVITADICRYLGNDALVRPGSYEVIDQRKLLSYIASED